MTGWMASSLLVRAPLARRRLLRSLAVAAAVVSGVVAPVALSDAVASADAGAGAGQTLEGQLVQAWAEAEPAEAGHDADGHEADGLVSWVQPAEGDPVLIESDAVDGVPTGSTVEVTVGPSTSDDEPLPVVDATVSSTPAVAPARVTNEVTVAMVAPAGSVPTGDGTPLAKVVAAVEDGAAPFWSAQTDGAIDLHVAATHDWAPASVGCAQPGLLWDEVAARVGFVPGPGKHLLLYVSRDSDCAYALAEVGRTPSSGGRLYVRDTTTSVIAHEFGHNFGLGHSSAQQCDGTVEGAVEGGSCRTVAYRDYYDVMGVSGAQTGTLNAAQAALLGALPASQHQALSVWGSATTETLSPLSGRAGTRALQLTDADGVGYWLEYRTATGQDGWLSSANRFGLETGVLLRRAGGLPDTSVLLDGTPSAAAGWDADYRAALPVGVAVPVSGGDFSVVVQSVSAAGAVVSVMPTPPAAAGTPAPAPQRAPGGVVMSGTGAAAEVPAEATDEPAKLWAPVHSRAVPASDTMLRSVADAESSTGYLVAVAGAALAGTTLLVARRLRARATGLR
jgi:Metallo-peptidase family M12B Reprolysin-like